MTGEPRVWDIPPPPDPSVKTLTDRYTHTWDRDGDNWVLRESRKVTGWPYVASWTYLFENYAPLTDATEGEVSPP